MKDEDTNINTEPEVDTDMGDDLSADLSDVALAKSEALAEEDVVFEENSEVTAPDWKEKVDKLKARIKELEKKNADLLDSWQRDKADFINARKKDDEIKKEFIKFSKADTIAEIIPVLDSFDGAFKNKESWEKVDKNWRTGVEFIHSQLFSILSQHGLKVINPMGQMYDHARDNAIENVPVQNESDDGKILEVVQVGYEFNGKEIRPPKVKISHYETK